MTLVPAFAQLRRPAFTLAKRRTVRENDGMEEQPREEPSWGRIGLEFLKAVWCILWVEPLFTLLLLVAFISLLLRCIP